MSGGGARDQAIRVTAALRDAAERLGRDQAAATPIGERDHDTVYRLEDRIVDVLAAAIDETETERRLYAEVDPGPERALRAVLRSASDRRVAAVAALDGEAG